MAVHCALQVGVDPSQHLGKSNQKIIQKNEHNDKNANVCIVVYLANWDKYTQTIQTIFNHAIRLLGRQCLAVSLAKMCMNCDDIWSPDISNPLAFHLHKNKSYIASYMLLKSVESFQ